MIKDMVPKSPEPVQTRCSTWRDDPYSMGAYSYIKPKGDPRVRRTLARPVSKSLFFAGEHTDWHSPATMQGGYMSGVRAALHVAKGGDKKICPCCTARENK